MGKVDGRQLSWRAQQVAQRAASFIHAPNIALDDGTLMAIACSTRWKRQAVPYACARTGERRVQKSGLT
jgi:hypothetical protein